jgi:hypothetical protein
MTTTARPPPGGKALPTHGAMIPPSTSPAKKPPSEPAWRRKPEATPRTATAMIRMRMSRSTEFTPTSIAASLTFLDVEGYADISRPSSLFERLVSKVSSA